MTNQSPILFVIIVFATLGILAFVLRCLLKAPKKKPSTASPLLDNSKPQIFVALDTKTLELALLALKPEGDKTSYLRLLHTLSLASPETLQNLQKFCKDQFNSEVYNHLNTPSEETSREDKDTSSVPTST
jgi:hypothetical protein